MFVAGVAVWANGMMSCPPTDPIVLSGTWSSEMRENLKQRILNVRPPRRVCTVHPLEGVNLQFIQACYAYGLVLDEDELPNLENIKSTCLETGLEFLTFDAPRRELRFTWPI
jgi:hypothetical protein